ncbi:C4-dicarboxylate ABC transporter [Streptomyces sp. NPDC005876]|uniref:SLAC1 family transporter n=1 Tax=Streptomyces sp. NPDC005876 TaxID=3157076 RepID=UPI0034088498
MVTAVPPVGTAGGLPRAARRPPRVPALRHLGPNWYACVMGTAIVATAGAALPWRVPGLRAACAAVWVLSLVLLAALLVARSLHWRHHQDQARAHLLDPAAAPFYGCLAMALLSVGGGALAAGRDLLGVRAAVAVDAVLFTAGTAVAVTVAVAVPYLMAVHHRIEPGQAGPVWLLPLVAPMVAAAQGPPLAAHLPAGQARETLLLACLALFGASLLATLLTLPLILARLLTTGPLPLALTPTLFLVLGPLGQSTTAVGHLADAAAPGYAVLAVLYGVPVTGFALLWLALATAHVVRAGRHGMGFSMTWWSFTFPVGTCATGAASLTRHTQLAVCAGLTVLLYAVLVAAWGVAAVRTVRGLVSGELLAAPRPAPGAPRPATARTR